MKTIKDLKNYVKYNTRIVLKDLVDIKSIHDVQQYTCHLQLRIYNFV